MIIISHNIILSAAAAFGVSLGLVLVMSCWEQARRQHPLNLIFLFLFTACESVLVATISSFYNTDIVLMAAGLTVGITVCLSLYAMQTKRDFTAAGGILFSLLFALIGAGILSIFIHSKVMNIAIAGIGAAVFACYIVFDVQLMIGSGSYSISPDEYVFAAINIYLVSGDRLAVALAVVSLHVKQLIAAPRASACTRAQSAFLSYCHPCRRCCRIAVARLGQLCHTLASTLSYSKRLECLFARSEVHGMLALLPV